MAADLDAAVDDTVWALECVPEDTQLKRDIVGKIHAAASPSTVILTNTSSIPIGVLRELTDWRALIATHFFNPADIVPGVEVSIADERDEAAARAIEDVLGALGKHSVRVAPAPGFIGNRLQLALFREAERCVAEGLATADQVDEIVRTTFGFRLPHYGPFQIADMAGLNVYRAILANLEQSYGDRFDCPESLATRDDAGSTGLAAGAGYYAYTAKQMNEAIPRRDARYHATLAID